MKRQGKERAQARKAHGGRIKCPQCVCVSQKAEKAACFRQRTNQGARQKKLKPQRGE